MLEASINDDGDKALLERCAKAGLKTSYFCGTARHADGRVWMIIFWETGWRLKRLYERDPARCKFTWRDDTAGHDCICGQLARHSDPVHICTRCSTPYLEIRPRCQTCGALIDKQFAVSSADGWFCSELHFKTFLHMRKLVTP